MKRIFLLLVLFLFTAMAGCSYAVEPQEPNLASPSSAVSTAPKTTPTIPPTPSPAPSPFPIELTALPEEYPPEVAASNGDYVSVHFQQVYNEEKLTAFLDAVSDRKSAAIRTVGYTDEGDPVITEAIFDGSKFTVQCDATRDKFGIRKIVQEEYKNMLKYELEDGRVFIFLTDQNEITNDMMENGFDAIVLAVIKNTPSPSAD